MYPPRRSASTTLLYLLLALLLAACTLLNAPEGDTRLRIRNESGYDLTGVRVASPGLDESFERLPAGGATEYRPVALSFLGAVRDR